MYPPQQLRLNQPLEVGMVFHGRKDRIGRRPRLLLFGLTANGVPQIRDRLLRVAGLVAMRSRDMAATV